MPGAYTHITLVNHARVPARLEKAGVSQQAIIAVMDYFRFCELGAVSPDYPYLDAFHSGASIWADLMHYERTGDMIKRGIELIRALPPASQAKPLAWLLGYTAHVVADMTIHPVVELKVGVYQDNKSAHRICELNQDAYIFQRMNLGDIGVCEHLDHGIWGCCEPHDSGQLDPAIVSLWESMLKQCHEQQFGDNRPNLHNWHAGFKRVVDAVEEGNCMMPFARHVAVNCGLTYPAVDAIDRQYIDKLKTPEGVMAFDQIFDRALNNVLATWAVVDKAIYSGDQSYKTAIGDWNLDTGRDQTGEYVFWKVKK